MGFRTGAYAKIWDITPGRGNTTNVRLSVSRRNKETNEYEPDFSGFCMFIGNAKAGAERLRQGDTIKLGDVDVCNRYDKEAGKEYYTHKVFSFEPVNNNGSYSANTTEENTSEGDTDDEGLPF